MKREKQSILFLIILVLISCDLGLRTETHSQVFEEFNRKGKYPRFRNSNLLIGNKVDYRIRKYLMLDTIDAEIYRISAQKTGNETELIRYYIYGLARQDSILSEVRIKSFKGNLEIGDYQIIGLENHTEIDYDYWIDESILTVQAMNGSKETHYSYYRFDEGQIINTTVIPDTIFRRQDLLPEIGVMIKIYDDFEERKLKITDQRKDIEGKIIQCFRGEDCGQYMIVKLTEEILNYSFLLIDCQVNRMTSIKGLESDSLIEGLESCLKSAAKTLDEPQLIHENAYVSYR